MPMPRKQPAGEPLSATHCKVGAEVFYVPMLKALRPYMVKIKRVEGSYAWVSEGDMVPFKIHISALQKAVEIYLLP